MKESRRPRTFDKEDSVDYTLNILCWGTVCVIVILILLLIINSIVNYD